MTNAAAHERIQQNDNLKEGHYDHEQAGLKMSLEAQAAMPSTRLYCAPENPSQNTEIAAMLAGFSLFSQPSGMQPDVMQPGTMNQPQQNDMSLGQVAAFGIAEAVMGGLAGVGQGFAGADTPAPDNTDNSCDYSPVSSDDSQSYQPSWMQRFQSSSY